MFAIEKSRLERRVNATKETMILVLRPEADERDVERLLAYIKGAGLTPLHLPGSERIVLGALGDERVLERLSLEAHPMVESVKPILHPYKWVGREVHPHDTVFSLRPAPSQAGITVGGGRFSVFVGVRALPGADGSAHLNSLALEAAAQQGVGAIYLTSEPAREPDLTDGRGNDTAAYAALAREAAFTRTFAYTFGLSDAEFYELCAQCTCIAVPSAATKHRRVVKLLAEVPHPILLVRDPAQGAEEWLMAAEALAKAGKSEIILVDAGIRTFETSARTTLDLGALPWLKEHTHLPVFVAPCVALGRRASVAQVTLAALVAGADGVLLDVHGQDGEWTETSQAQALDVQAFATLMSRLRTLASAVGREMVSGIGNGRLLQ